jgi:hypothetical protein
MLINGGCGKNIDKVRSVIGEKFVILQPKSVCCGHTLL